MKPLNEEGSKAQLCSSCDASQTVEYTCTDCGSLSDVLVSDYLDDDKYIECDCGERCEPSDSDEICELRAQGLIE